MTSGTVIDFDDHIGLGVVEATTGERFPFHCTQIAGDARTIVPGTHVSFEVVPRHKGDEAYSLEVIPAVSTQPN